MTFCAAIVHLHERPERCQHVWLLIGGDNDKVGWEKAGGETVYSLV
jgi:hypothetical protein